ncbi:MAG: hypothetical protein ABI813_10020, partial [Bacteroidota bacterium]
MKKFISAAVLSSILLVNAAFANKQDDVNIKVEASFKAAFAQAKNVRWQKTNEYYKAVFTINNQPVNAYFTPEGDLMGIIHNMLSTQLPINLQISLKKDYDGYWITDLFEFARPDSNGYFITLQNADQ